MSEEEKNKRLVIKQLLAELLGNNIEGIKITEAIYDQILDIFKIYIQEEVKKYMDSRDE